MSKLLVSITNVTKLSDENIAKLPNQLDKVFTTYNPDMDLEYVFLLTQNQYVDLVDFLSRNSTPYPSINNVVNIK